MAGEGGSGLDFGSANLENVSEAASHVFDLWKDGVVPLSFIFLFFVCVGFSYAWFSRHKDELHAKNWEISSWPIGVRLSLIPLLVAYALTHAFAAATVFYNTNIINPDSFVYFQSMGVGRLTALTHAHLFAHATMYFIIAMLVQFTRGGRFAKVLAPVIALWSGVFDVFAWWGIKEVSSNFQWLSAINGTLFSLSFLLMAFYILRDAFLCPKKKSITLNSSS